MESIWTDYGIFDIVRLHEDESLQLIFPINDGVHLKEQLNEDRCDLYKP